MALAVAATAAVLAVAEGAPATCEAAAEGAPASDDDDDAAPAAAEAEEVEEEEAAAVDASCESHGSSPAEEATPAPAEEDAAATAPAEATALAEEDGDEEAEEATAPQEEETVEEETATAEEEETAGSDDASSEEHRDIVTEPSIEAVEQHDAVLLGFYQPLARDGEDEEEEDATDATTVTFDAAVTHIATLIDDAVGQTMDLLSCGAPPAAADPAVPPAAEQTWFDYFGQAGHACPELRARDEDAPAKLQSLDVGGATTEVPSVEEEREDCAAVAPALAEVEARQ